MTLSLPGAGLPLDYYHPSSSHDAKPPAVFPSALFEWNSNTPTVRERAMLAFINQVTDKPRWWDKVNNNEIVARWKKEIAEAVIAQGGEGIEKMVAEARVIQAEVEVELKAKAEAQAGAEDEHEAVDAVPPGEKVAKPVEAEDGEDEDGDDTVNDGPEARTINDDDGDSHDDEDDHDDDDDDDHEDNLDSELDTMPVNDNQPDEVDNKDDEANSSQARLFSQGFSDAMFDYCIKELRDKAKLYKKNGIVSALDGAVGVYKSDTAVSEEIKQALRAAVKPLENVPEHEKDWHPGSNKQVLDLVHPSLWPLVFGKTRILHDRELNLETCAAPYGSGDSIPVPEYKPHGSEYAWNGNNLLYSTKFQWLPAEVDVSSSAKILSYINNLPPATNKELYSVIEKVIDASLPLWSATYDQTMAWSKVCNSGQEYIYGQKPEGVLSKSRIHALRGERVCGARDICKEHDYHCGFDMCSECRPGRPSEDELDGSEYDEDEEQEKNEKWFEGNHKVIPPEPEEYKFIGYTNYKSTGPWFAPYTDRSRIQVIVKLANIELTPENPSYPGGTWHIEGQLNENICATALYYFDNENVSDSHLAFRTTTDAESMCQTFAYEQSMHQDFIYLYDIQDPTDGSTSVPLGQVHTSEGRLLVWPNVLQHQVQPFELADKTKPGHRKILALFLVDPMAPVLSTANVPPQQKHWGNLGDVDSRLPPELSGIVYDNLACPYDLREAKKLREELMDERRVIKQSTDKQISSRSFSLCEH